jgi:pilus assembly protein FimV
MFAKMPRLLLMACVICPSLARALGLGEIHLNSALNEPLRAEIDLVAAAPEELTALRASIASREAFTRYGIDRPAFVSTFTFKVAKTPDGRDVLQVRSVDSIPEPFVTFLVEVNWARGRLMREYTVLLDPPTYTPGEAAGSAAPIAAAAVAAPTPSAPAQPSPPMPAATQPGPAAQRRSSLAPPQAAPAPAATQPSAPGTYRTVSGDTLTRIAQRVHGGTPGQVDQTMLAIYRTNPEAFDGNINLLRRGAILRIPGADDVAALNQKQAVDEVARQMAAWRGGAATAGGRLRLVTPKSSGDGSGSGSGAPGASAAGGTDIAALKNHVKDLEAQLAESRRAVDVSNAQLAELQRKLAAASASVVAAAASKAPAAPAAAPVAAAPAPATPAPATPAPTAPTAVAPAPAATPAAASAPAASTAEEPAKPVAAPPKAATPAPATDQGGSLLDMLLDYWQVLAALIAVLLAALGFAAYKRRGARSDTDSLSALAGSTSSRNDVAVQGNLSDSYNVTESFAPGDTSEIKAAPGAVATEAAAAPVRSPAPSRSADETMSAESPVSIDQGDPIAEADFHMAYGLYDQAADLVRMAIEREPDRRDLRMKLLEIYFVWGNAENFLSAAKDLSATRDTAPAGEWDKVMIMGRQICPDEEMFRQGAGGTHSADQSVDLNLDGGENHVDIDLFGESSIERAATGEPVAREPNARDSDPTAETGESPHLSGNSLDFMLDAPERGAEPQRSGAEASHDEPTVESEQMLFNGDALVTGNRDDHTAEVEIQDLGFDLDQLEATDTPSGVSALEKTDKSAAEAPTVISGLDNSARRRLADTQPTAKDTDLTQLEKELEASFIAELAASSDDIKGDIAQGSAPTVNMPASVDTAATGSFGNVRADAADADPHNTDSTARMEGISPESLDLDFSQLTSELGAGGARHDDGQGETAVREAFDDSQRLRAVDLDLGETVARPVAIPNAMDTVEARQLTIKDRVDEGIPGGEFAPVTMSEVGTKLDLARAYMDMGDPEGARSILEEVVQEGSASQKKEATRLIQSLPG